MERRHNRSMASPLDSQKLKKLSKSLALALRHRPDRVGLELEPGGWVEVDKLLAAMKMTRSELDRVVRENDKQRFAYDDAGTRIRASQGHSVPVDLDLQAVAPPDVLYHGTYVEALNEILAQGLDKMQRHAVHLSADADTATKVGSRRGKPVVLRVDAKAMAENGHVFQRSDNGVWLTERVPPEYIRLASDA